MLICLSIFGHFECQRDFLIYGEDEEKLASPNIVVPFVESMESTEPRIEPSATQLTKGDELPTTTELLMDLRDRVLETESMTTTEPTSSTELNLGYFAENSSVIFDEFEFTYDYEPSSKNLVTYNSTSKPNKSSFDFELMLHWFIGVILTSIMILLLTTLLLCCIKLVKSCASLVPIDFF